MIIEADKDGIKIIQQLCDVALKTGGVANLKGVNDVLSSLTEIKPIKKEKKCARQDPK